VKLVCTFVGVSEFGHVWNSADIECYAVFEMSWLLDICNNDICIKATIKMFKFTYSL